MRDWFKTHKAGGAVILIAVGFGIFAASTLLYYNVFHVLERDKIRDNWTITVTHKECVTYGMILNSHKYLIWGVDSDGVMHVFEDTDYPIEDKYNSSDYYGEITVGNTYDLYTVGDRMPENSEYPNILGYEEIP
jgi:hypothetical protein